MPRSVGIGKALLIARILHFEVIVLLTALIMVFDLGPWAIAGLGLVAILLAFEHTLVKATDLSKMNAAFFTMNGVISIVFFCGIAVDLLTRK
jgi:4-hydroxybenzoate polyprenyltransferase